MALEVNGSTITSFAGDEIDLSKVETLLHASSHPWNSGHRPPGPSRRWKTSQPTSRVEQMAHNMRDARISLEFKPGQVAGKTIAAIFEAVAEDHLIQPTIIYDFPVAISPAVEKQAG